MQIDKTPIKDLLVITPQVYTDDRGYFMESYNHKKWNEFLKTEFLQDNESLSQKGVLRGLHFQKPPFSQAKLVRVVKGSVLDVAVDLRKSSPTYGQHFKVLLSAENKKQFFVPKGFAHGFLCLEDDTLFSYKCSHYFHADSEGVIKWNDATIGIDWGVENPIISERDALAPSFNSFQTPFK